MKFSHLISLGPVFLFLRYWYLFQKSIVRIKYVYKVPNMWNIVDIHLLFHSVLSMKEDYLIPEASLVFYKFSHVE